MSTSDKTPEDITKTPEDITKKVEEMKITPWEADVSTKETGEVNYDHIIQQFGCQKFMKTFNESIEEITKKKPHRFISRELCFAHRDFDKLLAMAKEGKKFYLYTGRGPSSKSMHIGHSIPFLMCKYFQDAFKCPFVIQITDDEKFIFKEKLTLEDATDYGLENIKDIIAFGLDPKLTYIFSNYKQGHIFARNTLRVSKLINMNEAFKVFGFDMSSNIGMVGFPAKEIAPAFSSSFDFLGKNMPCLIPCAVDQDPFFRLARDKANVLGELKPSSLYVSLLPDLRGVNKKMSASDASSSIYLSDTPKEIEKKIKKHAFSGGQSTLELQKELGANLHTDIAYQYLRFFLDDEEELNRIGTEYSAGRMLTSEVKDTCIKTVQKFIAEFQERRAKITDEDIQVFMDMAKKME